MARIELEGTVCPVRVVSSSAKADKPKEACQSLIEEHLEIGLRRLITVSIKQHYSLMQSMDVKSAIDDFHA